MDESSNPIAEQRRRLYKVITNAPKAQLSADEQERLQHSKEKSHQMLGKHKSDEPTLLIGVLKYYKGDVEEQKRIFRDFFAQWPKLDLQILKSIIENKDSYPTDHPFAKHGLTWRGLSQSHGRLFLDLLTEAIVQSDISQEGEQKDDASNVR